MSAQGTSARSRGARSTIALAIGNCLLLAACGGGSAGTAAPTTATGGGGPTTPPAVSTSAVPGSSSDTAPQACSLLSKAEIEAAVGNAVADGVADIANACKWEKSDPTKISVGLHLLGLSDGEKCAAGRAGSSPVTGLGVDASWDFVAAAETGSVVACPAGWQVQVTLVGDLVGQTTKEATLRTAGEQLMQLVLQRM